MTYAALIARRIPPDETQLQLLVGTLLGRGRLVASADGVRLVLALDDRHAWLAEWTYERLAPLVPPPRRRLGRVVIRSEAHPIFGELLQRFAARHRVRGILGPEAVRLWALYERVAACERLGAHACRCELLRRLRRRALVAAS